MNLLDHASGEVEAAAAASRLAEMRVDGPRATQSRRGGAADVVVTVAIAETYVHGARMS